MDYYFRSDVDVLVVPKNNESLDSLVLPESWFPLGITAPEKFASFNKSLVKGKNPTEEELNFDYDMDIGGQDGVNSTESSVIMEGSPQRTIPNQLHFNDMAGADQMDDIFLSSLFDEDVVDMDSFNGSFSYSSESKYDMMQADDIFTDVNLGSERNSGHLDNLGSSKYLKTHAFSPSVDWEESEFDAASRDFYNRRQENILPVKAPVVPYGQNGRSGHGGVEECVLQELESVMEQLSEATRICFRDALYRLAENSKQEHAVDRRQNEDIFENPSPSTTVQDETSRMGKSKDAESETNTIDRAIANLMFHKMDSSDQNVHTPANFKGEVVGTAKSFGCSNKDSDISHFRNSSSSESDAEVPIFDRDNNLQMDFSSGMLSFL